jgi:hypothetical protein
LLGRAADGVTPEFDSWQIYFTHISFLFSDYGVREGDSGAEPDAVGISYVQGSR